MKKKTYYNLFFPIGILCLMAFISKYEYENPKPIKEILEKMHLIEGRTFAVGMNEFDKTTENDSTLLFWNNPHRPAVDSFYISATEVTNIEWREFYLAMRDKLGVEKAVELYYPDTLIWIKEFPFSYMKVLTEAYFQNPDFGDYPVVGISWVQAQDYCKWKSQMLKSAAKGHSELINLAFRLPTQNEWELAANGPPNSIGVRGKVIYPWKGYSYQKDGKYLANFGKIEDLNGAIAKTDADDDALYTIAVGNYPPNLWGLYDMAGNVAEWVSDTAGIYYNHKKMVYELMDFDSIIQFCENQKILNWHDADYYEYYKQKLIHDREVLSKGDMRLIKGGSWRDGLAYLQIGSKEAIDRKSVV